MAHRVLPALVLAPLLLCGRAMAGDPPAPASPPAPPKVEAPAGDGPGWHKQLAHRNARYASLTRVHDPAGDLHEAIVAHMNLDRVGDPTGDMEEVRVARASGKVPPRATADALVARGRDVDGDSGETVLAAGTHHRRFAETRRFRDIGGDKRELVIHQRDRQRRNKLQDENRVLTAGEVQRGDVLDQRDEALDSNAERADQLREQRREDMMFGHDDDRVTDRIAETELGSDELGAEGLLEGMIDDAADATDERLEEKLLENQTEAQAERAEGGGTGTTPGTP